MLRSGGEPLSSEHKLSEYSGVGTETNPVFLIRRQNQQDVISTQEQEAVDSLLKSKQHSIIVFLCSFFKGFMREHNLWIAPKLVHSLYLIIQNWPRTA